jgi:hypothetical protein
MRRRHLIIETEEARRAGNVSVLIVLIAIAPFSLLGRRN